MHGRFRLAKPEVGDASVDIRALLLVLLRRWRVVAATIVLTIMCGIAFLLLVPPEYTAEASLMLDPGDTKSLEEALGFGFENPVIANQMTVISSQTLLRRVVLKENLVDDSEFGNGPGGTSPFARLLRIVGIGSSSAEEAAVPTAAPTEDQILGSIGRLQRALEVMQVGTASVVRVGVSSLSRTKAANLANAICDAFLVDQLEARYDSAKRAAGWLSDRMTLLKQEVQDAEEKVETFRRDNGLIGVRGSTLTQQQLGELNSELVTQRVDVEEKLAKYKTAQQVLDQGGVGVGVPDIQLSPLITSLREKYAEAAQSEADLEHRYGSRHPLVVSARAARRELEQQIVSEIGRIVSTLKNDYEVSKAREAALSRNLGALSGDTAEGNEIMVKLRDLERNAETSRTVYEAFLQHFKLSEEQAQLDTPDGRLISRAVAPGQPSFPKRNLVLAVSVALGLVFGLSGAFAIDFLDNTFKTSQEVEEVLGLPVLTSLPRLDQASEGAREAPHRFILKKPLSKFNESIRSLRAGIQMSNVDEQPKLVQVVSALPGEGKTMTSLSLAASAKQAGQKVLIVDCDLRRPALSKSMGMANAPGLVDYLVGKEKLESVVHVEPDTRLHVIPSGSATKNPSDLLSSQKMADLLRLLESAYDLVVVDTPPVVAVVDAILLARETKTVVFIVEAAATPRDVVRRAVSEFDSGDHRVAGVVLNGHRVGSARYYGRYGMSYYGYRSKYGGYGKIDKYYSE